MQMLNLLPMQQISAQFFIQRLWRFFCRGAVAVILVMLGLYGLQIIYLAHIKAQIRDLTSSLLSQETAMMHYEKSPIQVAAHAVNKKVLMVLNRIPQLMPDDMHLMHVQWVESLGVLEGYAKNETTVTDFINILISDSGFKEIVWVENNKSQGAQMIYFKIHILDGL